MKQNYFKKAFVGTALVLSAMILSTGAVFAEEQSTETAETQLDGVENIKAYAHVTDTGEVTDSLELTLKDPSAFSDLAEDSFTVNGSADGVSFELQENVLTLSCPDTPLNDQSIFACEDPAIYFTGIDITEIEDPSIADFEEASFTGSNGTEILYRIRKGTGENQPLVLFFHGAGECGTDNRMHITANRGALAWAEYTPDATVLAAQYPEKYSTPFEDGQKEFMMQYLAAYTELIQSLTTDGIADAGRVYLTGLSMGGGLAWEFATNYPELFAGIVTCATRGTISESENNLDDLSKCVEIPTWVYHAAGDIVNNVKNTTGIYNKLAELGNTNVHMTIYDSTGEEMNQYFCHCSWIPALKDSIMMDWLFEQSK